MAELKEGEAIDNPSMLEEFIRALQYIADNYPDDVVEGFAHIKGVGEQEGHRECLILREASHERLVHDIARKRRERDDKAL